MASGDIKVPVNDLNNIGRNFQKKAEELNNTLNNLIESMQQILDSSEGDFKKVALTANKTVKSNASAGIEKIKIFGDWCVEAATEFENADKEAARKAQLT